MSARIFSARRDANEGPIVKALEAFGASVVKVSGKGAPDLLVGYRGVTVLIEVKMPKGRDKPAQLEWRQKWRGGLQVVVRDVASAVDVLRQVAAAELPVNAWDDAHQHGQGTPAVLSEATTAGRAYHKGAP